MNKKSRFLISTLALIIVSSFFISCSDELVNPEKLDLGSEYSSQYSDSLIFLSNRFSSAASEFGICIICTNGTGLREIFGKWNVKQISWDLINGNIFFAADTSLDGNTRHIFQRSLSGANEQHLFSTGSRISDIEISPDGRQLAFLESIGEQNRLSLLDIGTKEVTHCTEYLTELRDLSWAPDGSSIGCAYHSNGNIYLKIFDLDELRFTSERTFIDMVIENNYLDWCRNNSSIAINVNHYGFAVSYAHEYTTKADTNITAGNYIVDGLSWSPDGTRIAYAQTYNHLSVSSIYIYDKNGTNAFKLTDDLFDDKFPRWQ